MRHESQCQGHRRPVTTALLAAACGGMLSPKTVQATPAIETTDYVNTFAARTTLPPGTDFVQGTLTNPNDFDDFFRLTGLAPSEPLTVAYTASTTTTVTLELRVLSDSNTFLGFTSRTLQPSDGVISGSFPITVPADGVIVPHTQYFEAGAGVLSYTIAVPEPASAAAALVGLGALALLGRRKSSAPSESPELA